MIEYIRYVHNVFDIFGNILNMSVTAVEIGLTGLYHTILEVLITFVTNDKREDDPAEKLEELGWSWPTLCTLLLNKYEEEVLDIDGPVLDRLLKRCIQPSFNVFRRWLYLKAKHQRPIKLVKLRLYVFKLLDARFTELHIYQS